MEFSQEVEDLYRRAVPMQLQEELAHQAVEKEKKRKEYMKQWRMKKKK